VYVWDNETDKLAFLEARHTLYDEDFEITDTQKIETKDGLYLGMSLRELKEWNGDDFKFMGFGWDYGGTIMSEEGSKLNKSPVKIQLDLQDYEGGEFAMGDVELSTDDSWLYALNIIVSDFTYILAEE
jgi:hypothetical protein